MWVHRSCRQAGSKMAKWYKIIHFAILDFTILHLSSFSEFDLITDQRQNTERFLRFKILVEIII
jgi:hypothetical protein